MLASTGAATPAHAAWLRSSSHIAAAAPWRTCRKVGAQAVGEQPADERALDRGL
jgi:hypothetical protein